MKQILHAGVMLFIAMLLQVLYGLGQFSVVTLLISLIITMLLLQTRKPFLILFCRFLYVVIALYHQALLCYLPLISYADYEPKQRYMYLVYALPFIYHISSLSPFMSVSIIISFIIAMLLQYADEYDAKHQLAYLEQRDATKELANMLYDQNHQMLIQQEQEIEIATLNERNRIAREIHDHVGHLLSSALLQIAALQAVQQDHILQQPLQDLQMTVSTGMNNVRRSVHNLYDDSIHMETEVRKLLQDFTFCHSTFEYDLIHPLPKRCNYHLFAIIKECMNNTMKHSNATEFSIRMCEQPAFYQMTIVDNGTNFIEEHSGIGLKNIKQRVDEMHAYLHIEHVSGFKVLITMMKEEL